MVFYCACCGGMKSLWGRLRGKDPNCEKGGKGGSGKGFQRLPKNVSPLNYTICLKPDLVKLVFEGSIAIKLKVNEKTDKIQLNGHELVVQKAQWENEDGKFQEAAAFDLDEQSQIICVEFDPSIPAGVTGNLHLNYTGVLNGELCGFYRAQYFVKGQVRYNATTQFEPSDARRCFPCWDEPAIKSTFDISLIAPKNRVALSNMPVKNKYTHRTNPDLDVVEFERTPFMSTYLVATVVGEFEFVEGATKDGVVCRIYTPPGRRDQGDFGLECAKKMIPFFNSYFGVSYPLPKMDLVAISDFAAGAMENWGLLTFRETALLVDPVDSSSSSKQYVATLIGHEIAHQWFGNLVTMEWWTDLWLKEGYATYSQTLVVDSLYPSFEVWVQFVLKITAKALELDSLGSSHPVEVLVGDPSEVKQIFDDISYNKGAAIIRMLAEYIGEKDFKKGMSQYLNKYKYSNTVTQDLWDVLGAASGKPIGNIMSTWTRQMGFPLLTVSWETKGNNRVFKIKQEKFNRSVFMKSSKNYKWLVPITFTSGKDPTKSIHSVIMDQITMTVTIENVKKEEWVKVNAGAVGFYRVSYPRESLKNFVAAMKSKSMTVVDRINMFDELFALVQAGKNSTSELFAFFEASVEEDNYTVWSTMTSIMGKLGTVLEYADKFPKFKNYCLFLVEKLYNKYGWKENPNDGHLEKILRTLAVSHMIIFEHKGAVDEARAMFERFMAGKENIPADLRRAVYLAVIYNGDESVFTKMTNYYRSTESNEEQSRISAAFSAFENEALVQKAIEFSVSKDVRPGDTVPMLTSICANKYGRAAAWKFFKEKYELFSKRYSGGSMLGTLLVKGICNNFASEEMAKEIEEFFKTHKMPGVERAVEQSVENIRINHAWLTRDRAVVQEYMDTFNF